MGRLRLILTLVRFQGHRIGATLALRASDLHLTPERVREALAALGESESDAADMPDGAIVWQAAHDKIGRTHVTAMHPAVRQEVEAYLRRNPKLGEALLFPADAKPVREGDAPAEPVSLRTDVAARWLRKAEVLAGLPKIEAGCWHPYRRLFATRLRHLLDIDGGGWRLENPAGDEALLPAGYRIRCPEGDSERVTNTSKGETSGEPQHLRKPG